MTKLRIGVIGATAGFGEGRRQAFQANPRARVVAVCARTKDAVARLGRAIGARAYTDWADLIADRNVEAVSIAVPNALHFEITRAALAAGKHTLVEYPLCQTLAQLDELLGLAQAKGVVLHHALTTRGEPLHRKLKELAPRLGQFFHAHYRYFGDAHWYVNPALRGDLFVALHIHFLDQFEDIMGRTLRLNATAAVLWAGERSIHSATVLQEFADGANAFQEFGMGFPAKPTYSGWYIGENGWLGFEVAQIGETPKVRLVLADGTDRTCAPDSDDVVASDTANFLAQVLDGAPSWVPEAQTRRALTLALAASESAQKGRKIEADEMHR